MCRLILAMYCIDCTVAIHLSIHQMREFWNHQSRETFRELKRVSQIHEAHI